MKRITKEKIENINKEDFINYFNNHNNKETREYFKLTRKQFELVLNKFELTSHDKSFVSYFIPKCELEEYYKNHTIKECSRYFGVCVGVITRHLNYYNIEKHSISENIKISSLNNFGTENPFQSEIIKEKCRNTKFKKYGDEKFINSEKAKKTCREKYGNNCSLHGINQQKTDLIFEQKYGNKSYFASDIGKEKLKEVFLTKYGVEYPGQINFGFNSKYSQEYLDLRFNKEKSIEFLKNNYMTREELGKRFNCSPSSINTWVRTFGLYDLVKWEPQKSVSKEEKELLNYIKSITNLEILENDRKVLNGKEIDIYIPEIHIGFEFNGDYFHSDLNKDKNYHFEKSKLAEENGVRLIHIYEHELINKEKIYSIINNALGNSNKIYARNCNIKEITNKEARDFNIINHLQNHRNAKITYGLFYNNELVQLMSFSKHKKYDWEIIRSCTKLNTIVVGGLSKLLNYFVKNNNPKQIFSYCDFNKFNGLGYEKLGFKFIGYTGPDMKWLLPGGQVVNRNPSKHNYLKSIARAKIYGSGSKKYLKTI